MPGWLADFFRFWWGLLYWNVRKTLFRWRGSRCPCQNPSDSGRALETTCDACLQWRQPIRFQRVCPLLVMTPTGLHCSVDTKDVRPFWGRAAGFYGGAFTAIYLAVVIGAFAFLRIIGYPVRFVTVVWPPAWREVGQARSEFFYKKAQLAIAANRVNEAVQALSYAYELNPHNLQIGLLLARLWQVSQPLWSDQIYARLLHDNDAEFAPIAEQWYRAMLARGDFSKIAEVAPVFIARDATHSPVWMHALFFSTRHLADSKPLRKMLDEDQSLSPGLRRLVEIELLGETGHIDDAHKALRSLPMDTSYTAYYQINELTVLDFPDEALAALDRNANLVPQHDGFALRLDAFAAKGWQSLVRNEVELILSAPTNAPLVELLCEHFIRHPDPKLLGELFDKLRQEPLPSSPDAYQATLALFCAAGVNADWTDLQITRGKLREITGSAFTTLDLLESFFRGQSAQQQLGSVLPILQPMSIDVTYALFEHYDSNKVAFAP